MPNKTPGARGAQGHSGHRGVPGVLRSVGQPFWGHGGAESDDVRCELDGHEAMQRGPRGALRRAAALWRPHAAEAGTAPAPRPAAHRHPLPIAARSAWLPAYLLAVPCKLVSSVKLFLTLRKLAST